MSDWSTLEDEVKEAQEGFALVRCPIARILGDLTEEDGASLRRILAVSEYTHQAIADVLHRRMGADAPSTNAIGRHRRGRCKCGRTPNG